MTTQPPETYPDCAWADQPITAPGTPPNDFIGTAATVEPRTGLTRRYLIRAWDPASRTLTLTPDIKEDLAGVARHFPDEERAQARTVDLDDLDDVRLLHRRTRADLTALHAPWCRHILKAAFTAGGDKGAPRHRRVYKFLLRTTEDRLYRFLVHAPSQNDAARLARRWWEGVPTADGYTGGHLLHGERIEHLTCEGARDMRWPHAEPIADPL